MKHVFAMTIGLGTFAACAVPVEDGCASAADCPASEACDTTKKPTVPRGDGGPGGDGALDAGPWDDGPVGPAGDSTPDLGRDLPAGCDLDGDGHAGVQCGGADCDETDAAVHPDAVETCTDDLDMNCDGDDGDGCDDDGDGACDAAQDPAHCTDCCDETAQAHPGQGLRFGVATACGHFDYDCDGMEEPEVTAIAGGCFCGAPTCFPDGDTAWWPDGIIAACGEPGTLLSCPEYCPCEPTGTPYTQRCR
jgi:hypothetical protein